MNRYSEIPYRLSFSNSEKAKDGTVFLYDTIPGGYICVDESKTVLVYTRNLAEAIEYDWRGQEWTSFIMT